MNIVGLVPVLNVEDVGSAVYFYKDALGFRLEESYECDGELLWASLSFGSVRIMLHQPPWAESDVRRDAQAWTGAVLFFWVEDARALHADLAARGYEVSALKAADGGAEEFYMRDPDGYELGFATMLPARAAVSA